MVKKRKRSVDETHTSKANQYFQQGLKKSKLHPEYNEIYSKNTVPVLREMTRKIGNKKWYSLRKANLVCVVLIHRSACIICKFLKSVSQKKRDFILKTSRNDGSKCPITLDLISEISDKDIFVHDGVVFSKDHLAEYVMVSIDFSNPITRNMMNYFDIERLSLPNFPELLDKYEDRVYLRYREVEAIRDFSFWETELDNLFLCLGHLYYEQGTQSFRDTREKFHNTWEEMKRIDRNRTLIVVTSLKQSASRFRGRTRRWMDIFIESYHNET